LQSPLSSGRTSAIRNKTSVPCTALSSAVALHEFTSPRSLFIYVFEKFAVSCQDFVLAQMKIFALTPNWKRIPFRRSIRSKAKPGCSRQVVLRALLAAGVSASFLPSSAASAEQTDPEKPIVVQPGAPGAPSKILPSSTRAILPPRSPADVEFMQGMILHHAQAVEMTAMIPSHTKNKDLRCLGARISSSQSDEIKFMKHWLAAREESVPQGTSKMPGMDMSNDMKSLMPGMLTPQQMEALEKAKGVEFDRLFFVGMIQHHNGALTMVKDLFDTAGAGQDAELFNFANDADNTQRAEISIMEILLKKEISEEKQ
jgi:uncharacterized protein (DUF305 family)